MNCIQENKSIIIYISEMDISDKCLGDILRTISLHEILVMGIREQCHT